MANLGDRRRPVSSCEVIKWVAAAFVETQGQADPWRGRYPSTASFDVGTGAGHVRSRGCARFGWVSASSGVHNGFRSYCRKRHGRGDRAWRQKGERNDGDY